MGSRRSALPGHLPRSVAVAALLSAALVAGCDPSSPAPGGAPGTAQAEVTPTIDANKQISLTVWTLESGQRLTAMQQLTDSFQHKYPNVHVTLVQRASANYNTQVILALKGHTPPDVVEGLNGFALDAAFVKAHLIQPLDRYAKALGWLTRYSPDIRRQWQLGPDGATFGTGALWGVAQAGELGGWFYNRQQFAAIGGTIPTTEAEFDSLLARSKAAGQTPIMLGNIDGWPATHIFNMINDQVAPVSDLQGIAFTDRAAAWDSPAFVSSAQKLVDWVKAGYFPSGYDGFNQDDAVARFAKGTGLLLQCGSWCTAAIQQAMGSNVGYFLPPPVVAGTPSRSTGALSNPFHISAFTKYPDAAVIYLDRLTNEAASEVYARGGDLPGTALSTDVTAPGTVSSEVYAAYQTVLKNQALMPYPDWSLPQIGSVYYAKLQEIMAGKTTPADGLAAVQANRISYYDQQGVPK